ncbi:MAG: hypothetical protein EPN36_10165 [Rhodanobacteraceae bacterium]|nr:MAG: hypothetical protein EPN36_10165 [Rhodanobacteraceae bacterium]
MSKIDCNRLLEDYVAACNYPGAFDAWAIEESLREYLRLIGADRKVVRLSSLQRLSDNPSLEQQVRMIVRRLSYGEDSAQGCRDAIVRRDCPQRLSVLELLYHDDIRKIRPVHAFDETRLYETHVAADAACVTRALRTASIRYVQTICRDRKAVVGDVQMLQFARWCVQLAGTRDWGDELHWCGFSYVTAVKNRSRRIVAWLRPLYDAFVSGCWMLHWTADTLFWVAKPTVHTDAGLLPRLHNANGPALGSDVEDLYSWHGVVVPAHVITHPQSITPDEIDREINMEVRRVLIERYGVGRYYRDSGAQIIQRDTSGLLYRKTIPGEEPVVMVRVLNSTPEPDGVMSREEAIEIFGNAACAALNAPEGSRFKEYMLRVPPDIRTAREAVAWTFELQADAYHPSIES